MVAKVPVLKGETTTVTMMAYGFDPYLSSWSPYHGAVYAVTQSVAKIVAAGGDFRKIHFTFQEYFRRMTEDPERWSQPFSALLGAYEAQLRYGLASIGGKDSMSGTFNDIDVPPTLVSFAVDVAHLKDVLTPELKKAGDRLVWIHIPKDEYELPDYDGVMDLYDRVHQDMQAGRVAAAYVVERSGIAAAVSKMAFGNKLGVKIEHSVDPRDLFSPYFGDMILEVPQEKVGELACTYTVIGEVTDDGVFSYSNTSIPVDEAIRTWMGTLSGVFKRVWRRRIQVLRTPDAAEEEKSPSARINLRSRPCSSPYSPEPTVSMTVQELLKMPVRAPSRRYSAIRTHRISLTPWMNSEKVSNRHRSSCSPADFPQVTNRTDPPSSSLRHSEMRRSEKRFRICSQSVTDWFSVSATVSRH